MLRAMVHHRATAKADETAPSPSAPSSPVLSSSTQPQGDDEQIVCPPARMSGRGIFLLVMACTTFEAFALFVLLELAQFLGPSAAWPPRTHDPWTQQFRRVCAWILVSAIPLTWFVEAYGWLPSSIMTESSLPKGTTSSSRRNYTARIFQSVAWVLYAAFLTTWVLCGAVHESVPSSTKWKFCSFDYDTGMVALAFLAEILMVSSILALERQPHHRVANKADIHEPMTTITARKERLVVMLNNYNNMLLVVGAVLLAIGSELTRLSVLTTDDDKPSTVLLGASGEYSLSAGLGSLALCIAALFNTYGLGGVLATRHGWRFFQPFTGGFRFMLFQAISWTCFAVGIFLQGLYLLSIVIVELELFVGAMAVAGGLFLISEVVMMMSLLVYKGKTSDHDEQRQRSATVSSSFQQRLEAFTDDCLGALLVGTLANLQWVPSALFVVLYAVTTPLSFLDVIAYALCTTFVEFTIVVSRSIATHWHNQDSRNGTLPHVSPYRLKYVLPQFCAFALPGLATVYHVHHDHPAKTPLALLSGYFYVYIFTYRGKPQLTGSRMKPHWRTATSRIIETCARYFDGKILKDAELDPTRPYVMAFHPHGIMSTSVMWMTFTDQWRRLFPGVYTHILTASVLHQIPWVRDVLQFYGGREVTREAFASTLRERESVLLVPGGQAEMLEQHSGQRQVRVYTKHKGFLRLAIQHGVPLVPILSFREGETMDNVRAPLIQRWFVKTLAFPFPYFPYGRMYLPIPRRKQIVIAVGAPLEVEQKDEPTHEDVDRVHAEYFTRLRALFDKYKDDAGCSDFELVLL